MTTGTRELGSGFVPSAARRARRRSRGLLTAAVLLVLGALATPPSAQARPAVTHTPRPAAVTTSVRHRVTPGENLFRIAKSYGVTVANLCRANGIKDSGQIEVGRVLFVPVTRASHKADSAGRGGRGAAAPKIMSASLSDSRSRPTAQRTSARSSSTSASLTAPGSTSDTPRAKGSASRTKSRADRVIDPPDSLRVDGAAPFHEASDTSDPEEARGGEGGANGISFSLIPSEEPFSWPVQGGIVRSPFGMRHGRQHAGIDICAPSGSPIYAARDGSVAYSGHKYSGYGNVVMIDHGDGFITVYAHNVANLVHEGDRVVRGQMIARVGATGNATGAHCHFEIRNENISVNPRSYLSETPEDDVLFAKGGAPPGSALTLKQAGAAATADMIP